MDFTPISLFQRELNLQVEQTLAVAFENSGCSSLKTGEDLMILVRGALCSFNISNENDYPH